MAHRGEPGLSIGIVHDQELVRARGFGYADLSEKISTTAATRYRIASITKLFTSTGILMLRDAGALRLDDPVERHLPWFDIRQRFPDAPAITIRHLLTHTAGLPREAAFPYWTDANFPTREQVRDVLPRQETRLPTVPISYGQRGSDPIASQYLPESRYAAPPAFTAPARAPLRCRRTPPWRDSRTTSAGRRPGSSAGR